MTLREQLGWHLYLLDARRFGARSTPPIPWADIGEGRRAVYCEHANRIIGAMPLIGAAEDMGNMLADIIPRFEKCMIASGTDPEFAAEAVKPARDVLAKGEGID